MLLKIFLLCLWIPYLHAWTHLELGAANYGAAKEANRGYDPNVQYRVLFWTLEELIDRYGVDGTFYINDIDVDACEYCAEKLREYVEMHRYPISIVSFPADYKNLKWDLPILDSLHLKNPEAHFFRDRNEIRSILRNLSSYSKSGLYLFILYAGVFFPESEKREFVDRGLFYQFTDDWGAINYYAPTGHKIEKGRVFHISAEETYTDYPK